MLILSRLIPDIVEGEVHGEKIIGYNTYIAYAVM